MLVMGLGGSAFAAEVAPESSYATLADFLEDEDARNRLIEQLREQAAEVDSDGADGNPVQNGHATQRVMIGGTEESVASRLAVALQGFTAVLSNDLSNTRGALGAGVARCRYSLSPCWHCWWLTFCCDCSPRSAQSRVISATGRTTANRHTAPEAPATATVRQLPMQPETARYWNRWLSLGIGLTGYSLLVVPVTQAVLLPSVGRLLVLVLMLGATLQSGVAIAAGTLLAAALSSLLTRHVALPESWNRSFPSLETQVNIYVPAALKGLRLLILIVVTLVVLDAWPVLIWLPG